MKTKKFHLASGSEFGRKIGENLGAKRAVATAIVEKILSKNQVDTLFINDGTSTAYVWCRYIEYWVKSRPQQKLSVWTNNHDVHMQALCEDGARGVINIKVAPGDFDYSFCAAIGDEATKWVSEMCRGKTCLLAVTALDAQLGPCARTHGAKEIKRVIIDSAENLIVVADSVKLSQDRQPFVAANASMWSEWLNKRPERLWVVTNLDNAIQVPYKAYQSPSTSVEWQTENAKQLRDMLGDNFIRARP